MDFLTALQRFFGLENPEPKYYSKSNIYTGNSILNNDKGSWNYSDPASVQTLGIYKPTISNGLTQNSLLTTKEVQPLNFSSYDKSANIDSIVNSNNSLDSSGSLFGNLDANSLAQYGNLALQGIQALGGLYMGNKMYGLAKDQFNFQKDFANRNLANSMKTYNNALADRINSRYAFEGRSQAEADDYLKKHSL